MAAFRRASRSLQRHGMRSILVLASYVLAVCTFLVIAEVVAVGADWSPELRQDLKRGTKPHVLFCSVALEKHLVPLLRMAEELHARGFEISFASHDEAYAEVLKIVPDARFVSTGPLPGGGGPGPGGGRGDDDPRRWMSVDEELGALSRSDFANNRNLFGHHFGLSNLMQVLYMPSIKPFYNALMHFAAECYGGEAHYGAAATRAANLRERTTTPSSVRPLMDEIASGLCTRRPDLVVMDVWTFGARDAADVMGVPVVVNSPSIGYRIGASKVPWHPGPFSGLPADMTFANRMFNVWQPRLVHFAMEQWLGRLNKLRWARRLPLFTSIGDVASRSPAIIMNSAMPGLELSRVPESAEVFVGPVLPRGILSKTAHQYTLTPSLQRWLQCGDAVDEECAGSARKSLNVLVYLGSMPRVQAEQAKAILLALDNDRNHSQSTGSNSAVTNSTAAAEQNLHEIRALWLLPSSQREALARASLMIAAEDARREALLRRHSSSPPSNSHPLFYTSVGGARGLGGVLPSREFPKAVRLLSLKNKWNNPLLGALSSNEIDVVLSHCDSATVQEALIFAKPVLCVPFFGDHFDVAQRLHESGAGTWADKMSLDPSEVRRTLLEMAAGKKALRVGSAPLSPSSASFSSSIALPGSRAARRAAAAAREAIAVAAGKVAAARSALPTLPSGRPTVLRGGIEPFNTNVFGMCLDDEERWAPWLTKARQWQILNNRAMAGREYYEMKLQAEAEAKAEGALGWEAHAALSMSSSPKGTAVAPAKKGASKSSRTSAPSPSSFDDDFDDDDGDEMDEVKTTRRSGKSSSTKRRKEDKESKNKGLPRPGSVFEAITDNDLLPVDYFAAKRVGEYRLKQVGAIRAAVDDARQKLDVATALGTAKSIPPSAARAGVTIKGLSFATHAKRLSMLLRHSGGTERAADVIGGLATKAAAQGGARGERHRPLASSSSASLVSAWGLDILAVFVALGCIAAAGARLFLLLVSTILSKFFKAWRGTFSSTRRSQAKRAEWWRQASILEVVTFVVDTSFRVLIFCGTIPFAILFRVESEANSERAMSSSDTHDEVYTPGEDSSGGSSTSRSSGASAGASTSSPSGGGKGSASTNSSATTSSKNNNDDESIVEEDEDEDLTELSLEALLGRDAKLAKEVRRVDKIMMKRMSAAANDVANRVGWRSNITQKPKAETKSERTSAIFKEEEEKKAESGLGDGSDTGRPGPPKMQSSWGPKNDVDELFDAVEDLHERANKTRKELAE